MKLKPIDFVPATCPWCEGEMERDLKDDHITAMCKDCGWPCRVLADQILIFEPILEDDGDGPISE